jgi:hypothetical protein
MKDLYQVLRFLGGGHSIRRCRGWPITPEPAGPGRASRIGETAARLYANAEGPRCGSRCPVAGEGVCRRRARGRTSLQLATVAPAKQKPLRSNKGNPNCGGGQGPKAANPRGKKKPFHGVEKKEVLRTRPPASKKSPHAVTKKPKPCTRGANKKASTQWKKDITPGPQGKTKGPPRGGQKERVLKVGGPQNRIKPNDW